MKRYRIEKKFTTYKGVKLSSDTISYLENTSLEKIRERAEDLKFKSWCPVAMVNDSEKLRKDMKVASEMLFAFIEHKKLNKEL
jgi:hypothetical protein|tara:strand:- start:2970 stop:3218 length:249 start_codon:yes stop_codon:yes gene_type:complete